MGKKCNNNEYAVERQDVQKKSIPFIPLKPFCAAGLKMGRNEWVGTRFLKHFRSRVESKHF